MALGQDTRNRLQRFVNNARELLTDEFIRQLQQDYGMDPEAGTVSELASLTHLDDSRLETAQLLRDIQAHYLGAARSGTAKKAQQDVLLRIAREQAFSVLNRLVALRMMEARGLLQESVAQGYQSKGFELYARLAGPALGDSGEAYRRFLFSLFDEFAVELPQLFDRYSPQGRLFPRDTAMLDLLALINDEELESLWAEDETIGWIYQYFNSKEERKAMRGASQAPRNSRELAVRNQFFTPRYVVEFLVDNTLARLWFNWLGGQTGLRDRCQYLLVKPSEKPEPAECLRDPRTIRVLDPACGSMHFGLYAFDLFLDIYREAWAWEQTHGPGCLDTETGGSSELKPLSQTYVDQDAFLHDVPRLIIEHNIYGVDIDARATQIATLALWLRAQRSWNDAGVKAKDRPAVGQGHVIAAVAPPPEPGLREQMATNLDGHDAKLFEETLKLLKGLPELGVLLRMEQEIPHLIRTIYGEAGELFAEEDMARWEKAESRLHEALAAFIKVAQVSYKGRLFAHDALEGLRLIDLGREKFDVVVMNPPFGERTSNTKAYIDTNYPNSKLDLGACFVERASFLLRAGGRIGVITNRTLATIQRFDKWRIRLIEGIGLESFVDLGHGVLDAMVETAMYICGGGSRTSDEERCYSSFINLLESSRKENDLNAAIKGGEFVYEIDTSDFLNIPGSPWAYWVPVSVLRRFDPVESFLGQGGAVSQGLASGDDFRFYRLRWEVPPASINLRPHIEDPRFDAHRWSPVTKGGEYSLWWDDIHLVVNWASNGKEMKNFFKNGCLASRIGNTAKLFRAGGCYPYRTTSAFGARYLPPGMSFSVGGWALFPPENWSIEQMLAVFNSRIVRYLMEVLLGQGDSSASGTAARNYGAAGVGGIPWPRTPPPGVESKVRSLVDTRAMHTLDETALLFSGIQVFGSGAKGFDRSLHSFWHAQCDVWEKAVEDYLFIESQVLDSYQFTSAELECIDQSEGESLGSYPNAPVSPDLVAKWFTFSVTELTETAKDECGSKRFVLKKAFFIDRVIDLACHTLKVHPSAVIHAAREAGPIACGIRKDFSKAFVGWLVGVAFRKFEINPNKIDGSFFKLESLPTEALPSLNSTIPILVDDADSLMDIGIYFREALQRWSSTGASDFESDLCSSLDVGDIRDYFRSARGFFADHLEVYSKSRRKAPIYWPLSTSCGSYTVWIYYSELDHQTLYTVVNDFLEPKLKSVDDVLNTLRSKSGRTAPEDRELEKQQDLRQELIELRDTILEIAPSYKPNQDDGVQITAAPLWMLFRHKPWQKVLKDTWGQLEAGEYDWAHLAYSYWPDRVREKCKTDKSLAIAHGLEELYEEPAA